MLLRELFEPQSNATFDWKLKQDRYRAKIVLGTDEINIHFYAREAGVYLVEFTVNDELDITGSGNAIQIFNTVLAGIRDFIAKYTPNYLVFDAEEPSRVKLYTRIVQRLGTDMGYRSINERDLPHEYLRNSADDLYHTPFVLKRVSED